MNERDAKPRGTPSLSVVGGCQSYLACPEQSTSENSPNLVGVEADPERLRSEEQEGKSCLAYRHERS